MEKKKIKIALIAPFEESVPPKKYGGTELVVSNITETLVDKGFDVHLIATGDSVTSAKLHKTFPTAIRGGSLGQDLKLREAMKYTGVANVLKILSDLKPDIIHNHIGWRFIPFESLFGVPMITTMHGPLDNPAHRTFFELFRAHNYVSISRSQCEPAANLNFVGTVYNGIDISRFDFEAEQGKYLAFLGRMSPEKGPKIAIEVAKKFGMRLIMAAKIDAVDKEYFTKEIEPHIDNKNIVFIGEVGPKEKNELLKGAYALLGPIQWREPFGLFMVEAMACGTPVVVTNMGAAPEIIENGKTGFVVENTVDTFVLALGKIPSISRLACRTHVERNFTKEVMTENYIKIYNKLLEKNIEN